MFKNAEVLDKLTQANDVNDFTAIFDKHLKVLDKDPSKFVRYMQKAGLNGADANNFRTLNDGSIIYYNTQQFNAGCGYMEDGPYESGMASSLKYPCMQLYVDVNGFKAPNKPGKDLYSFFITKYGAVADGHLDGGSGLDCAMYVVANHKLCDMDVEYPDDDDNDDDDDDDCDNNSEQCCAELNNSNFCTDKIVCCSDGSNCHPYNCDNGNCYTLGCSGNNCPDASSCGGGKCYVSCASGGENHIYPYEPGDDDNNDNDDDSNNETCTFDSAFEGCTNLPEGCGPLITTLPDGSTITSDNTIICEGDNTPVDPIPECNGDCIHIPNGDEGDYVDEHFAADDGCSNSEGFCDGARISYSNDYYGYNCNSNLHPNHTMDIHLELLYRNCGSIKITCNKYCYCWIYFDHIGCHEAGLE